MWYLKKVLWKSLCRLWNLFEIPQRTVKIKSKLIFFNNIFWNIWVCVRVTNLFKIYWHATVGSCCNLWDPDYCILVGEDRLGLLQDSPKTLIKYLREICMILGYGKMILYLATAHASILGSSWIKSAPEALFVSLVSFYQTGKHFWQLSVWFTFSFQYKF